MNLTLKGLIELVNNVNFDKDLRVFYLSSLAEQEQKDTFMKYYHSVESYLDELVKKSTDLEVLNRVKNIISFRTKILDMKM